MLAAASIYDWKIFYEGPTVCCKITTWNNNLLHHHVIQPNSKSRLLFLFSLTIWNNWESQITKKVKVIDDLVLLLIEFHSTRNPIYLGLTLQIYNSCQMHSLFYKTPLLFEYRDNLLFVHIYFKFWLELKRPLCVNFYRIQVILGSEVPTMNVCIHICVVQT